MSVEELAKHLKRLTRAEREQLALIIKDTLEMEDGIPL